MDVVLYEDVDMDVLACEHFDDLKTELGVKSVWSIWDFGTKGLDYAVFVKKMRKVTYEFVRPDATAEEIYNDLQNGTNDTKVQVSSWAMDGTIKSLWYAADSCIEQSGTHHRYIENFIVSDDGTLELVTGS